MTEKMLSKEEELMRRIEELEGKNKRLEELLISVSHEILGAATSAGGAAKTLIKEKFGENSPEQKVELEIINNGLLFIEIIAKGFLIHRKDVWAPGGKLLDFKDGVLEILEKIHRKAMSKYDISLRVEIPEKRILIHKYILHQLLASVRNVQHNAINQMIHEPIERIIWLRVEITDDYLKIHISNSGAAVSEKFIPGLFEKKPSKKGFGVGLYSCRNNLEQIGGKIEYKTIENRPTFIISFPIKDESVVLQ